MSISILTEDEGFALDGVAAAITRLTMEHAERINEIVEGTLLFRIWPDGGVEMLVTTLVAEASYEFEDGRVAVRNADVLALARAES